LAWNVTLVVLPGFTVLKVAVLSVVAPDASATEAVTV
jgi:hypothetical protein